ncbi:MAG: O-antigen ligase family protein, partial [Candidatus Pacebacteria bacterium]|nr:O-antigen ligase family protein [Candidatus Paceibacterota bacterium]
VIQLLLANLQFFKQSNLFSYRFLGETSLTNSINIARTQFKTGLTITPYGSTAHPNILAGFLMVYAIILLNKLELKKINHQYFGWLLIFLVSWTIFLTQAYSAIIALTIYLTLKTFPQLKSKLSISLFLALTVGGSILLVYLDKSFSDLSLKRRIFLNQQGLKIWLENFILGTGLNSFLYSLKSNYSSEIVRFIQPVHHTLLLWLTETGLIGLGLLATIKAWLMKEKTLILLFTFLPIITLDHYLLTQWVGGWLILVMVSLTE